MKLPAPLSDADRQRVQTALDKLTAAHPAFEGKLAAFATASAALESAERMLDAARHNASRFPADAARRDALAEQIGPVRQRRHAAKHEMEAAHAVAVAAIQRAGLVVGKVCAPLLTQFRAGLTDALRPFCADSAAVAAQITERSELPALRQFLSRGQFVTKHTSAQEVEQLTFELGQTLQRILDGGEIWKLREHPVSHR